MRALYGICLHDHRTHRGTLCGAQEDTRPDEDHREEEGCHLSAQGWRGGIPEEVYRRRPSCGHVDRLHRGREDSHQRGTITGA